MTDKIIEQRIKKATNTVYNTIKKHFKEDGWNLRYSYFLDEIFYQAFGFNLERFFLMKLVDKKSCCFLLLEDGSLTLVKKPKKWDGIAIKIKKKKTERKVKK